jgi:UDP-N-acetyl-D-glucosamine dehydrogenase
MTSKPIFLSRYAAPLFEKLSSRTARTGVVGLGYVGLPLAVEFCRAGFTVVGIDVDQRKCDAVNRGQALIDFVDASDVAALVAAGRLSARAYIDTADALDTISICVPTPLGDAKDPDLSYVTDAVHAVKAQLRPGMLVILESTTYPGTTEELVRSILEETGLTAGKDFFLAYAPERVDPGLLGSVSRPRVVGGITSDCAILAAELYEAVVDQVVKVSSPRAAEMTKLLENTFRAVNIGFINEFALMCEHLGINVWEVIEAAATKPAGFMPFYPGPGLGGHCIPIDPFYLSWKARQVGIEARFIELAGEINEAMPGHVVAKVVCALHGQRKEIDGSNVLVLGVAYKRDVDDVRESPALEVMALLQKAGAVVTYHDPFVSRIESRQWTGGHEVESSPYSRELLRAADCVVLLTDHTDFDLAEIVSEAPLVVDTRNAAGTNSPNVFKLGVPNPVDGD